MIAAAVFWALLHSIGYVWLSWYLGAAVGEWCTKASFNVDCHHPLHRLRVRGNETTLKVIVQGAGQTGTTSVIQALRELGLTAWHADDYAVFAKYIMYDHPVDVPRWLQTVRRCGMEAMSMEPVMDMFPLALGTSPNAKVIISWRPYESWLKSLASNAVKERNFGNFSRSFYRAPFFLPWVEAFDYLTGNMEAMRLRAKPFFQDGISLASLMYKVTCNGYAWPATNIYDRGTRKIRAGEEAYLAVIDEARRLTPKGQLLEFDVRRHGWPEFAKFLGVKPPPAGTPFPHPRSKDKRTNEEPFERDPVRGKIVWFLLCVMHAANYFVVWAVVQAIVATVMSAISGLSPAATAAGGQTVGGGGWSVAKAGDDLAGRNGGAADAASGACARTAGSAQRLADALKDSPVIVALAAGEPSEVLDAGKVLVDAGVRAIEVSVQSEGALECIAALARALPSGILVGASSVVSQEDVGNAAKAGASFVRSPHNGAGVVRRARRLGILGLAGACTPGEAHGALAAGADGIALFPAELVSAEALRHFRPLSPPPSPLLAVWIGECPSAETVAGYRAAGASGFVLPAATLLQGGGGHAAARRRLEDLLRER